MSQVDGNPGGKNKDLRAFWQVLGLLTLTPTLMNQSRQSLSEYYITPSVKSHYSQQIMIP